jgi:hypothetical protein
VVNFDQFRRSLSSDTKTKRKSIAQEKASRS